MDKKKIIGIVAFIAILLIVLFSVYLIYYHEDSGNSNEITSEIITESSSLDVEYSSTELTGEWSDYTAKITLNDSKVTIEGSGVTTSGDSIVISSGGTYYITGSISDGTIVVKASKSEDVQLVLDNASITSTSTAPINGVTCNKLTITLADNSTNTLTDSSTYTEFTDTESSEPDGTLFTKTDLVINGNGKLVIDANYGDGIVSKDGLKIINCTIEITSADDGIRGKDYVAINNATITIDSTGDGIKSTNDTDTSLGYVAIEGGTINITASQDGIQAETVLNISSNPTISITTNGSVSSSNVSQYARNYGYSTSSSSSSDVSSKGLKAGTEITIENGDIEITSTDDTIHSNGIIIINGGTFKLSSGDDGIHADTNIVINGGTINITKSYEGIESAYIEINDGTISVVASDDGINVAGGNDSSSVNDRIGQNSFSSVGSSNQQLVINRGNITVNATGDGLDANGSIYINGGTVLVAGPTDSANGALDYDSECAITGGDVIIYGASGMWQNPSSSSTQYCLTFQTSGSSGDTVVLKDSSGNEITSFTTVKSYGAITISNSSIQKGETYTLYINGSSVGSIQANSIVSSASSSNMNNMQQGGAGTMQGGMRR